MSNILNQLNIPVFGSSEEDRLVLDALRSLDDKVLSESKMRHATKNEVINSLRHTKQLANRVSRIGLAFYLAWRYKHDVKPEFLIRTAKASARMFDPKSFHGKED